MNILETPRLIVRHLEPDDLDNVYAVTSDPDVMHYVDNNQPLTREETQRWLDISLRHYEIFGYGYCALIDKSTGEFAGLGGLAPSPDSPGEVELAYILKKAYWGMGLATEIAQALLDFGFNQVGLKRIIATIDPHNLPSRRVAEKLGMKYERTAPDEHGLPTAFYALERGD